MVANSSCNICSSAARRIVGFAAVPPIQNYLLKTREEAHNFPNSAAEYFWCAKCQHISIRKTQCVDFDENYDNRQTSSGVAVGQFKAVAGDIEGQLPNRDATIVEIGCGHGELLEMLYHQGYRNLKGYDPAAPAATPMIANIRWSGANGTTGADLIIARHTIEEIPDPDAFIGLMARSLTAGGFVYCEITNASRLLGGDGVFSLYPECSNLFSAFSLSTLYARHGLSVEKITSINGGEWLGIWGRRASNQTFDDFESRLLATRNRLCALPKPVVLWGGAGRGMNILSFLALGLDDIEAVVDLNPTKQGLFIPPFGQKVISVGELAARKPKSIVVANSKYLSEILAMSPPGCEVVTIGDLVPSFDC